MTDIEAPSARTARFIKERQQADENRAKAALATETATATPATPPAAEPKEAPTDGTQPSSVRTGDNAVADPARGATKPADGGTDPVATETAPASAAATKPADKPADKPTEEADKQPKSASDWAKWKENRAKAESDYKTKISTLETKLKEYESKVAEVEKLKATSGELPPDIQARIEALQKENEDYSNRLATLEVTQHPKFVDYFKRVTDAQIQRAKTIVGTEKADMVEKVLLMPDSDFRTEKMDEILSDLRPSQTAGLNAIMTRLIEIDDERQAEIAKSAQSREKMQFERTEQAKRQQKEYETLFSKTLQSLKDPKEGLAVFQDRDGDAEWNNENAAMVQQAATWLQGKVTPEEGIRAAMHAAAFPRMSKLYQRDLQNFQTTIAERDSKIAELEQRINSLSAVQPGVTPTITADTAGNPTEVRTELKAGTAPWKATELFAKRHSPR